LLLNENNINYCPRCHSDNLWFSGLGMSIKEVTKPRTPDELMRFAHATELRFLLKDV